MIYPLTKGLIGSMCLRYAHSFGMSDDMVPKEYRNTFLIKLVLTKEDKLKIAYKMVEFYRLFSFGHEPITPTDNQLLEEMNGKGFYHPEKELNYAAILPKEFELK